MITSGKNFYNQSTDFKIKRYRLVFVSLGRQKQRDADPKTIQQIEFVGQLKTDDGRVS